MPNSSNQSKTRPMLSIGLISGTSMDAIDIAVLGTDGLNQIKFLGSTEVKYPEEIRIHLLSVAKDKKQALLQKNSEMEKKITNIFADGIRQCVQEANIVLEDVDVIGCHGQTVYHEPAAKITCQLADCQLLADQLSVPVVGDFRQRDIDQGGQGAPLAPIYHLALVKNKSLPVAILNLGGVGNVTFIEDAHSILAFDTGPANALIDDFVLQRTGNKFDDKGKLAKAGSIYEEIIATYQKDEYFLLIHPKSLDRYHFHYLMPEIEKLSDEDGAATLLEMTVSSIEIAQKYLPRPPKKWLVTGGGRRNLYLMEQLATRLDIPVEPIESIGVRGDSLEAECFAYLAVRRLKELPSSFPTTTGVNRPLGLGEVYKPNSG